MREAVAVAESKNRLDLLLPVGFYVLEHFADSRKVSNQLEALEPRYLTLLALDSLLHPWQQLIGPGFDVAWRIREQFCQLKAILKKKNFHKKFFCYSSLMFPCPGRMSGSLPRCLLQVNVWINVPAIIFIRATLSIIGSHYNALVFTECQFHPAMHAIIAFQRIIHRFMFIVKSSFHSLNLTTTKNGNYNNAFVRANFKLLW